MKQMIDFVVRGMSCAFCRKIRTRGYRIGERLNRANRAARLFSTPSGSGPDRRTTAASHELVVKSGRIPASGIRALPPQGPVPSARDCRWISLAGERKRGAIRQIHPREAAEFLRLPLLLPAE
jgi:hypothetical protein